jgi:acetyl esterase/lipase
MVRLVFTVMPGNVIFEFASNYIRAGVPPSALYISPGQHSVSSLKDLPAAAVYTCGLEEAGIQVTWHQYETLCHGLSADGPLDLYCHESAASSCTGFKRYNQEWSEIDTQDIA